MRAKNVINYYVLCNKLKDKIRSGWIQWEVNRERLESVADHTFGTLNLAIAIYSEYEYDIGLNKVLFMLAIHEIEEIIIGDITIRDSNYHMKEELGHKAIKEILKDLKMKYDLENLILEFDEKKTKEALFAHYCDKLECDIQAKLYDEENCIDINKYDLEKSELKNHSDEKSWSNMWIEFDRRLYKDDNFIEIIDYLKNNEIKSE